MISWLLEHLRDPVTSLCERVATYARSEQTFLSEGEPYLTRHYFTRRSRAEDDEARSTLGVYLHYFHRGDIDPSLHNHPWDWSFSIILTNGYIEERWNELKRIVEKRVLRPGNLNVIRADDFHRVELRDTTRGAWTLFFAGKRVRDDWGFWWPGVHEFVPHTQYSRSSHGQQRTDQVSGS